MCGGGAALSIPLEDDELDLLDEVEEVVVEWRKSLRCGWESCNVKWKRAA